MYTLILSYSVLNIFLHGVKVLSRESNSPDKHLQVCAKKLIPLPVITCSRFLEDFLGREVLFCPGVQRFFYLIVSFLSIGLKVTV